MLLKNDVPPTSRDEADARRMRPPPERYDPDNLSHWSITMTLAWIIRRDLDAVRNEWDVYRDECADWSSCRRHRPRKGRRHRDESSTGQIARSGLQKDLKKGSWHFHQWNSLDGSTMFEGDLENIRRKRDRLALACSGRRQDQGYRA